MTDIKLAFAALLDIEEHVKKMGGSFVNLTTGEADFRTSVTRICESPLVTVNVLFTPSALREYIARSQGRVPDKE
jgi:hypothetical protein